MNRRLRWVGIPSGPDFQVLAGDDAFIAPTVLMGGAGAIAAAAHVATPLFVKMTASLATQHKRSTSQQRSFRSSPSDSANPIRRSGRGPSPDKDK